MDIDGYELEMEAYRSDLAERSIPDKIVDKIMTRFKTTLWLIIHYVFIC